MRTDARVALSATDPENPYRALMIRGRVVKITEEGADAHIDRLAKSTSTRTSIPFALPKRFASSTTSSPSKSHRRADENEPCVFGFFRRRPRASELFVLNGLVCLCLVGRLAVCPPRASARVFLLLATSRADPSGYARFSNLAHDGRAPSPEPVLIERRAPLRGRHPLAARASSHWKLGHDHPFLDRGVDGHELVHVSRVGRIDTSDLEFRGSLRDRKKGSLATPNCRRRRS